MRKTEASASVFYSVYARDRGKSRCAEMQKADFRMKIGFKA